MKLSCFIRKLWIVPVLSFCFLFSCKKDSTVTQVYKPEGTWTYFIEDTFLRNDTMIYSILCDSKNNMWFGTKNDGLIKYNEKDGWTKIDLTKFSSYTQNYVLTIFEDSKGNIWIYNLYGIFEQVDGQWKYFNSNKYPNIPTLIYSITEDNTGNIWFGTWGQGWYKYDGTSFTKCSPYRKNDVRNNIDAMKWFENKLYLATEGGLLQYTDDGIKRLTTANGLVSNGINCLLADNYGYLWIGSNAGLNYIKGDSIGIALNDHGFNGISEDNHGNLWLTGIGAEFYNGVSITKIYRKENGLLTNNIKCVAVDKNNNLWLGSYDKGIIKFTPN